MKALVYSEVEEGMCVCEQGGGLVGSCQFDSLRV